MGNTVVMHKGYDRNLSTRQKKNTALGIMVISAMVLIFYSTPNTITFFLSFMKDIKLLGIPYSGYIAAIVLGLAINGLEYFCIALAVWKSWYWMIAVFVGAVISIWASVGFQMFGNQLAHMKIDDIQSSKNMAIHYQKMIDSQDEIIRSRQKQIDELRGISDQHKQRKENVPSYIAFRMRKASEAIEEAIKIKSVYGDSLFRYQAESVKKQKDAGYIVSLGDEKQAKKSSLFIGFIAEAIIVIFGTYSFLLFDSAEIDRQKGIYSQKNDTHAKKSDVVFVDDKGTLKEVPKGTFGGVFRKGISTSPGVHVYGTVPQTKKGTPENNERGTVPRVQYDELPMNEIVNQAKNTGNPDQLIIALRRKHGWGYEKVGRSTADLMGRSSAYSKTKVKRVLVDAGLVRGRSDG